MWPRNIAKGLIDETIEMSDGAEQLIYELNLQSHQIQRTQLHSAVFPGYRIICAFPFRFRESQQMAIINTKNDNGCHCNLLIYSKATPKFALTRKFSLNENLQRLPVCGQIVELRGEIFATSDEMQRLHAFSIGQESLRELTISIPDSLDVENKAHTGMYDFYGLHFVFLLFLF